LNWKQLLHASQSPRASPIVNENLEHSSTKAKILCISTSMVLGRWSQRSKHQSDDPSHFSCARKESMDVDVVFKAHTMHPGAAVHSLQSTGVFLKEQHNLLQLHKTCMVD
jgi:hypothetical protein